MGASTSTETHARCGQVSLWYSQLSLSLSMPFSRARRIMLPTATSTPRPVPAISSRPEPSPSVYRNIFPRRPAAVDSDVEEPREQSPPRLLNSRKPIFPTRPRSGTSPTRSTRLAPSTREPSPARSTKSSIPPRLPRTNFPAPPSTVSGNDEDTSTSRLWQELRNVRNKSKAPSERHGGRHRY